MRVIYLVFNEGYSASSGDERVRVDLCAEALGLARLLTEFLPTPEADGLLALLLLQDARREARTTNSGDIVLLSEQDRRLWDKEAIEEGTALVERSLKSGGAGAYTIQAAITAVYSASIDGSAIDWDEIIALHDVLNRIAPSPVSQLARAIAIAERDGAVAALALVDALLEGGELDGYLPAHAARGDLCRRLDNKGEAIVSFRRALELAQQEPEQRYLRQEIARLESQSRGS
jgi:RNA polymerase sigma-70 factor (ECF subfamily)